MLVQLNDCTCLGYTQTFECTVFGGGVTIWSGSFFDCPRNEILLRHSQYGSQVIGECNQGTVTAKSVGLIIDNFCYTSQLIVTVEEETINGTIKCFHKDNIETLVGQRLMMSTGMSYPPPSNVHVESNDSSHNITFAWDEVPAQCPSLQYIITAINCGLCPNTTADKYVTCDLDLQSDISQHTNNTCLFAVQTEICGHLRGERSDYVMVHMFGEQYLFLTQS